jgi:hypothetical protein
MGLPGVYNATKIYMVATNVAEKQHMCTVFLRTTLRLLQHSVPGRMNGRLCSFCKALCFHLPQP